MSFANLRLLHLLPFSNPFNSEHTPIGVAQVLLLQTIYTNKKQPFFDEPKNNYLSNVIYFNEHGGQLWQVEVYVLVGEAEQLVGEVALHARLLGVEEVADGHVHVKQLAFEEPQQEVL